MTDLHSPELRTAKQVRRQLGDKSEVTLWRWINDPELNFPQPIKIRGQNHFDGAAIDRWIASQTKTAVGKDARRAGGQDATLDPPPVRRPDHPAEAGA